MPSAECFIFELFMKSLDIKIIPFYNVARYRLFGSVLHLYKGVREITCQRHFGGYLRAISNAMAQDMQQSSEANGLTCTQGMFLHHLWMRQRQGQRTYPRDLEEFFDIKHSTVSGVLQRMEAAGFVEVHASEADRRCKTVILTQKGLDAHTQTSQHIQQTEARLVQGMTEPEIAELRRLLEIAAHNLGVCMPHIGQNKKEEFHK